MGRKPRSITVTVRTLEGLPKAYGIIYALTCGRAHMAMSASLPVGETLRFRIFDHDPPKTTERFGKVLWTESIFNLVQHLAAECRVKWLSASEARELGDGCRETGRGG